MAADPGNDRPLRVAVTGATSDLGALLLPLLEADPGVERVLALDVARPEQLGGKFEYRRVDLARHEVDRVLGQLLSEERIDVLYHLAFLNSPITNAAFAHELEVIGTMQVLTAVASAKVRRLIVPSMTAVYGARSSNPAYLDETAHLHGAPDSRYVNDKVEVERQLRAFRVTHPETKILVLRFAPVLGPSVNNPISRLLSARLVPTLIGFDPLWQAVHEEDAARALHLSLHSDAEGELNIVGRGVISLSGMIRLAGGTVTPLPHPVARGAIRSLNAAGLLGVPIKLLDYIQYSWVADGRRAEEVLGYVPRYHTRDAVNAVRRST